MPSRAMPMHERHHHPPRDDDGDDDGDDDDGGTTRGGTPDSCFTRLPSRARVRPATAREEEAAAGRGPPRATAGKRQDERRQKERGPPAPVFCEFIIIIIIFWVEADLFINSDFFNVGEKYVSVFRGGVRLPRRLCCRQIRSCGGGARRFAGGEGPAATWTARRRDTSRRFAAFWRIRILGPRESGGAGDGWLRSLPPLPLVGASATSGEIETIMRNGLIVPF